MHNTALLLCNYRIIADKCTSAMNCLYENFNKLFKEYEHEYSTHSIYPILVFYNELLVN